MTRGKSAAREQKPVYLAITASIILFVVCISFILMLRDGIRQRESLAVTERYMTFESQVQRLLYSNLSLLRGFETYLVLHPDLDAEDAYAFLDYLLIDHLEYIHNVGVLEDTTILWNYPRDTNAESIGIDLAAVEAQRKFVLRVKEAGMPAIQGPVELVQGGSGFSIRVPIVRNGIYWGQTSIILKTETILAEIDAFAKAAELEVVLYNTEHPGTPFFGTAMPNEKYLPFVLDSTFLSWRVQVRPVDGWQNHTLLFLSLTVLAGVVSLCAGVTMRNHLINNSKIFAMSTHDHLTGLYNRHFLSDYQEMVLSAAKRENRKAAILIMDLDNFKDVNDTYGHSVGDKVLVETARLLQEFTRTEEAAFRLGGDEFLIVVPDIADAQSLKNLSRRLKRVFEQEFTVAGYPIRLSISVGYAIFPEHGRDFDALLRAADKLLYQEKGTTQAMRDTRRNGTAQP